MLSEPCWKRGGLQEMELTAVPKGSRRCVPPLRLDLDMNVTKLHTSLAYHTECDEPILISIFIC